MEIDKERQEKERQEESEYKYGKNDLYDLAQFRPQAWDDKVRDLWKDGRLTYHGHNLIKLYNKALDDNIINPDNFGKGYGQDLILGYTSDEDEFVSGWKLDAAKKYVVIYFTIGPHKEIKVTKWDIVPSIYGYYGYLRSSDIDMFIKLKKTR